MTEKVHKGTLKIESEEKTIGENTYEVPTVIILGPTGSGKTGVSIEIARKIGGEIISADSRAIYQGMDIGTAKPTKEEMQGVPHYGLDLVKPNQRFTVADWKKYAKEKIEEIKARGNIPIIVGGTGLYIDALIYDYKFKGPTGEKIGDFEQKSCSDRTDIKGNYLLVGIKWPTDELRARLYKRVTQMFGPPLYEETKKLVQQYGLDNNAMKSDIYEYAWNYISGKMDLDEAMKKCFYEDWHLAKRQMTWFKRNPDIVWLPIKDICSYIIKKLSKININD